MALMGWPVCTRHSSLGRVFFTEFWQGYRYYFPHFIRNVAQSLRACAQKSDGFKSRLYPFISRVSGAKLLNLLDLDFFVINVINGGNSASLKGIR